jgi:hypothetical protein
MSSFLLFCAYLVALEEENIDEGYPLASFVEELNNLELHLVKHRELFLSRQIETFKIDMVRYVSGELPLVPSGCWK